MIWSLSLLALHMDARNECVMLTLYSGHLVVLHRLPGVLGWMDSKLRGVLWHIDQGSVYSSCWLALVLFCGNNFDIDGLLPRYPSNEHTIPRDNMLATISESAGKGYYFKFPVLRSNRYDMCVVINCIVKRKMPVPLNASNAMTPPFFITGLTVSYPRQRTNTKQTRYPFTSQKCTIHRSQHRRRTPR